MGVSSSAGALAVASSPVTVVDPHLLVLAVLVAAWVIDKVLAAVEWLRGTRGEGTTDPSAPPVESGGSARESSQPSGAE